MGLRMGIDPARFIAAYWQKKPLLMRQAIDPLLFAIDANELAGLACEPEIESRLVIHDEQSGWQVQHGPFDADVFAALPVRDWTLLVQDVDKYAPEVTKLLDLFDFLPAWRIDDIMISYATDQGGVGPHTDAYDVFLMQGSGRRRWRLSNRPYTENQLIPDLDLRILAEFDTDEDWVLEPGDVLYLPPGVAHWGTAEGECMTYSLGFRTPNQRELAAEWFQHVVSQASKTALTDSTANQPIGFCGLDDTVVDNAQGLIEGLPSSADATFDAWLGCFLTEPKPQFHIDPPARPLSDIALSELLNAGDSLLRHPWARLTWRAVPDQRILLFCNGEAISLAVDDAHVVEIVCSQRRLGLDVFAAEDQAAASSLLLTLVNKGIFEVDEDT